MSGSLMPPVVPVASVTMHTCAHGMQGGSGVPFLLSSPAHLLCLSTPPPPFFPLPLSSPQLQLHNEVALVKRRRVVAVLSSSSSSAVVPALGGLRPLAAAAPPPGALEWAARDQEGFVPPSGWASGAAAPSLLLAGRNISGVEDLLLARQHGEAPPPPPPALVPHLLPHTCCPTPCPHPPLPHPRPGCRRQPVGGGAPLWRGAQQRPGVGAGEERVWW